MSTDDKFNMFDGIEEQKEEVEIVSVTVKPDSSRQRFSTVPQRTKEEYEEHIISTYKEIHVNSAGEEIEVNVQVLKPEVHPSEFLKPAYCYGTTR